MDVDPQSAHAALIAELERLLVDSRVQRELLRDLLDVVVRQLPSRDGSERR